MGRRQLTVALTGACLAVLLLVALGRVWAATPPRLAAVEPPASSADGATTFADEALAATGESAATADAAWAEVVPPTPLGAVVADAHAAGASRVHRLAIAVLDLRSGRLYSAGDIDAEFPSASLVKVFIAARLLVEGRAEDPAVRDAMSRMIVCSDDDAASWLYGLAGGDGLASWVSGYYGVAGVAPPIRPGWWGLTRVTARAMVHFYARIADDPVVGSWLREAMGSTQPYGCDGFYQHFGLPAAAQSWQVKQGWMCCHFDLSQMHSTGFVDDRYAVALLAEGPTWTYGEHGAQTLTLVAQALLPGGVLPSGKG